MLRPKQNGGLPSARAQKKPGSQKRAAVALPRGAKSSPPEAGFELLFSSNPLPMYVCDLHSLKFLEVNAAALRSYGYSRCKFLRMRITDLRPEEDIPRVLKSIESLTEGI